MDKEEAKVVARKLSNAISMLEEASCMIEEIFNKYGLHLELLTTYEERQEHLASWQALVNEWREYEEKRQRSR